ncbi:hypothetical protein EDD15DRAFT_2367512 [Pisolithus albus]|nr:hypothetical protein EDD15DRAFT_2367512 [Pisolithus albus]
MPSGRGRRAETKGGDTVDPPLPQNHPVASSRRSTRVTAGQGGHVIQLEKVGLAVEARRRPPKPLHQIPEDEPVNDMAPAPHRTKKATRKVTRESKNGGLGAPPNNMPSDQSSQLPASQDERPTVPEGVSQTSLTSCPSGSRFGLQLENPAAPTYVGSQTIDAYERDSTNNSTLSRTKKVTQLNPTARPQSGRSRAAIRTPQGLPTAAPSRPPAYKVLPQKQPSLSPSAEDVQHQPSSPLTLPSSPEVLRSSDNENPEDRVFDPIDLDEWAEDHIDPSDHDVNYENSDADKRKEDEVARHDDVDDHADDHSDDRQPGFETAMPARQQNSSQVLIPAAHVSSRQPGSLFPNHHQVRTSAQSSQLHLPPAARASRPSQLPAPSGGCPQPRAPIHSRLSQLQGAQPSRPCLPSQASLPHSSVQNPPPSPPQSNLGSGTSGGDRRDNRQAHRPGDERAGVDYDVLNRHHARNRRHRSPSPSYLSTISLPKLKKQRTTTEDELGLEEDNSEVTPGTPKLTGQGRRAKYSKNPKGSQPVKSSTAGFFPPLWNKLFDLAKSRMRLYVALEEPVPRHEVAIQGQCSEILFEVLAHYEEKNLEVEAGYYPQYKLDMAKLIFADTHTFRSEIKKAAIRIIPAQYQLFPPPSATTEADRRRAIKIRAEEILKGGAYLRGEVDAQGKTSNFAHDALKYVCLAVYYSNSVKSLRQFAEFQQYVPYKALLLVAAIIHEVLCIYKTHGFIPKESKLSSEALDSAFNTMVPKLEAVLSHAYHGPKLNAMLEEWANLGMTGYTPIGRPAAAQDSNHFDIILD